MSFTFIILVLGSCVWISWKLKIGIQTWLIYVGIDDFIIFRSFNLTLFSLKAILFFKFNFVWRVSCRTGTCF